MKKSKSFRYIKKKDSKSISKNEPEKKLESTKGIQKRENIKKKPQTKDLIEGYKKEKKKTSTNRDKDKLSQDKKKLKDSFLYLKERIKNKTLIIDKNNLSRDSKKNSKSSKNVPISMKNTLKNSSSQKNFTKIKNRNKKNLALSKTKTSNNFLKENDEMTNSLLISSDEFVKNLLSKYKDGTENIINEDLEGMNLIENSELDFSDEIDSERKNKKNNTVTKTLNLKKSRPSKEETKNDTSTKKKEKHSLTINANSIKKNKKVIKSQNNNKIKNNLYHSFMGTPSYINENKLSLKYKTKIGNHAKNKSISKRFNQKNNSEDGNNELNIKKKLMQSTKLAKRKKISTDIDNKIFPSSLGIIFEDHKNTVTHHYLENTISAKNKMVQKKKEKSAEKERNTFNKTEFNNDDSKNISNLRNSVIVKINKTPKANKNFLILNKLHTDNNNNKLEKRYSKRTYSHHTYRESMMDSDTLRMSTLSNSKNFNGKIDDYLITKELGKGSYAVVKLGVQKSTKNKYAIKIYSKEVLIDPQKRNTVKNEINILKLIDNEHVMKLYEVIDTSSNLYLVLEYINGTNLLNIIKNEKYHFLKEERAQKLFEQIVRGILYCHTKNIFHRDIKLENILVLKGDVIKIIDFGFSIKCNKDSYQKLFCGTPSYMSPEIVKKEKYIPCYSDIWSLGVLYYTMLFGIFPFKGRDDDEMFEKIKEAKIIFPDYNVIGKKTKEIFNKIFVVNPSQRISLDVLLQMLNEK